MKKILLALAIAAAFLSYPLGATTTVLIEDSITPINLNTVNAKVLSKSFRGIGVKRAAAIIKYRDSHGRFKTIDELGLVPGISKNFVRIHYEELKKAFVL
ncbi:ComEA family DNA-binding protein [Legionella dresdenensis]|uniref:ComEA family DNA-binding protein n=1 Tax=Legionella dresdenensis TaxID=450200 RepID=A0ABV8CHJ1_9GAMM